MNKKIEFFFDFGSPYTYLAYYALKKIAAKHSAEIVWRPFLLGAVFQATGNRSPAEVPAKLIYLNDDLQRWAQHIGVPLNLNPHFPINTMQLMRGAVALQGTAQFSRYVDAIFSAMFEKPRNMGQPEEVAKVLLENGFDPAEFMRLISQQSVKDELKKNTEEAVARGVFGAPTFFVGTKMFFGQDRLDFVEAALQS